MFDEPNLVSAAGLVPIMKLASEVGLRSVADRFLTVPTDKGANPGLKVSSLVAGMLAGADSIDDMAILRHGGMGRVFEAAYATSTLGSFLRSFTFGHVRQLDAVACRVLAGLRTATPLLNGVDGDVLVDVDDSIIEVHGYAKQGAGFGYSGVRGINALISTITVADRAPVIAASRLRKGSTGSPKGAARLVGDALATLRRLRSKGATGRVLLRADSAFYGHAVVHAAHLGGAQVSITVRQDKRVKAAIAAVPADGWTPIQYTDAVFDEQSQRWISRAEVAEINFTAFTSRPKAQRVPGRLVIRRIPDLAPKNGTAEPTLFDTWRFHAFLTTTPPEAAGTVLADQIHRRHAIIENVHADLKHSALAHLPGRFTANAAWLVLACIAFNLPPAAATIAAGSLTRATTGTIRRTLINVPTRVSGTANTLTLHLPTNWPWQQGWDLLFTKACGPPPKWAR